MSTVLSLSLYTLNADESPHQWNLQLFSAEEEGRTEPPTPRRIRKEREKGHVAKSNELPSALIVFFCFLVFSFIAKMQFARILVYTENIFDQIATISYKDFGWQEMRLLLFQGLSVIVAFVWPFMLIAVVIALGVEFAQVGFMPTTQQFEPNFNKFIPNEKRLRERFWPFSRQVVVNFGKAMLKVAIIGVFAWITISNNVINLTHLVFHNPVESLGLVSKLVIRLILMSTGVMLLLAILDYFYQKYEFTQSLKMTRHEFKQEWKEMEGDPVIKSELQNRMRQLINRNMLKQVPKADVVITNPTHFAVAVLYEIDIMEGPTVVAKGKDMMALRIMEIARAGEVPVVENPPLARAIYNSTELGEVIPPNLWEALRAITEFINRLKQKSWWNRWNHQAS